MGKGVVIISRAFFFFEKESGCFRFTRFQGENESMSLHTGAIGKPCATESARSGWRRKVGRDCCKELGQVARENRCCGFTATCSGRSGKDYLHGRIQVLPEQLIVQLSPRLQVHQIRRPPTSL
jgi:hypothetical protein